MLEAAFWGALAASTLVIGMLLAFVWTPAKRTLGLILAFGSGALLCAVSFELTDAAVELGGERLLAVGMLVGAGVFVAGTWFLRSKTDSGVPDAAEDSRSIILGAALDGIPESLAIGASIAAAQAVGSETVSLTLIVAVAMSNLPEALGATIGMRASGMSTGRIVSIWTGLAVTSSAAAAIGYEALSQARDGAGAFLAAFTAGAVVAMLADTMMPDAYRDAGRVAGAATAFGFGAALLVG
jgi:ZIP family zinc transporter